MTNSPKIQSRRLLTQLRELRLEKGITANELEEKMMLGPGWIEQFEEAKTIPTIDILLSLISTLGIDPHTLFSKLNTQENSDKFSHILDQLIIFSIVDYHPVDDLHAISY